MPVTRRACLASFAALAALSACGARTTVASRSPGDLQDVLALEAALLAMGPGIDREEAARAARVSYEHTHRLAVSYEIEDPPLVHNTKVNMGLKPRGLCWHWAEDMETRLRQESFRTFTLHRAIANHDKPFLIEHSTVILSARGDPMEAGMVIDPWRKGGVLTWVPTAEDDRYDWWPRREVFEWKRRRGLAPPETA